MWWLLLIICWSIVFSLVSVCLLLVPICSGLPFAMELNNTVTKQTAIIRFWSAIALLIISKTMITYTSSKYKMKYFLKIADSLRCSKCLNWSDFWLEIYIFYNIPYSLLHNFHCIIVCVSHGLCCVKYCLVQFFFITFHELLMAECMKEINEL